MGGIINHYEFKRCFMEFLMYPTTVKMLATEIISACDAYLSRKIGSDDLKKDYDTLCHQLP